MFLAQIGRCRNPFFIATQLLRISSVEHFWLNVAGIAAMAINTFVGRVLVNYDGLVADELRLNMALGTSHVGMPSGQRKVGSCVVIKR